MKRIVTFLIAVIFCLGLIPCSAMNTEVELTPLSAMESTSAFASLELRYHAKDPEIKERFQRFDVNEYGEYALLFDNEKSREYIVVYDENGVFQFALSWRGQRSSPSFEWDGDNLILYRAGSYAILLGRFGECLEVCKYYDRGTYLMSSVNHTEKEVGGDRYTAEYPLDFIFKWPFYLGNYTDLVKTTSDGESIVLYQSSGVPFVNVVFALFPVACCFVLYFIIKRAKQKQKDSLALRQKHPAE